MQLRSENFLIDYTESILDKAKLQIRIFKSEIKNADENLEYFMCGLPEII